MPAKKKRQGIRTFIAIDIPQDLRELIKGIRKDLEGVHGRVSWVRTENIHLTLKFLGEVDEARLPLVIKALEGAARGAPPLELCSGVLGAFPSMRRPRVLYLAIEENPGLMALSRAIEKELAKIGLSADKKPFRAHLTICRIRSPETGRALGGAAGELKVEKKVAFTADRFVLYKSELTPQGARYSVIRDFPLKQ